MIEIIKASAGSGKTFTLAKKYISLLLETKDRYAYRHILAVTFTNKATEEMKSRILKELHILATTPWKSDYYTDFVPQYYEDDAAIQEASTTVLCNILHDYGAFAVSTIDRFFQQTLKAFSREIGHFASYQIELDRNSLIAESVDRVLDSMTGDKKDEKKLKWLTENTISQLEKGEGYKLDYTLKNVAMRLKSEEHRTLVESEGLDESVVYSEDELMHLAEGCKKVCDDYLCAVKNAASKVGTAFAQAGLDPSDTMRQFMSKGLDKYLHITDSCQIPLITESFRNNAADLSKWFPKAKAYMMDMVTSGIIDSVADFVALFDHEFKVYNTALLLRSQVYGFGIANELHHEFEALLKEKNVLSLDDSNTILKNIIDGTETPFIYEKLGVRYENFLLDEFQDTSRVQWDNFRPLLKNSVDSGFYNLIVGDVKQSIYRFRDSDWKLLRDDAPKSFGENVKPDTLKENWRSFGNIVRFNNSFFSRVALALDNKYSTASEDGVVSRIYEDVGQVVKKRGDGCVKMTFCPGENQLQAIYDSIMTALTKGYAYKDIAILVRTNKDGAAIAEHLISHQIRVVTDDSLLISSSLTVRRLVSLLSSIDNPDDSTARYLAAHLDVEVPQSYSSLIDLCEDLLRKLKNYKEDVFASEVLYIQSFMDRLRDYVEVNGNSLHAFLKDWEGNKDNISSPKVGDAVRIMTIHKSKGLDFRYVIVPYLEGVGLVKPEKKWCKPDVSGTSLEGVAAGVYDVTLSGKSEHTLFAPHYKEETLLQFVDNVNVVYVALTRAKECMEIIAELPSDDISNVIKGIGQFKEKDGRKGEYEALDMASLDDFSKILYWYAHSYGSELGFVPVETSACEEDEPEQQIQSFVYGEIPQARQDNEEDGLIPMSTEFCSWPLNPVDGIEDAPVNERGRLKFNADATDFFTEDGVAGISASQRVRGVVLHDILSDVCIPDDLEYAVESAVVAGRISVEEAPGVLSLLKDSIMSVLAHEWFPEDRHSVLNEVELVDSDGEVYRPDRVVRVGNSVRIVDYKFGEKRNRYERQVRKYAALYGRMGYTVESACLWYVTTGEIVKVV